MNSFLSKKFKCLSFIAMVAVVYTHAYNFQNSFLEPATKISEGLNIYACIEFFISNGIVRFAVPLFAFTSAYLLFYKWENSFKFYIKEVIKRVKSLFVPYIIWTSISGLFCIVISKFIFDSNIINEFAYVYKEGIITFFNKPAAFQFWYFRDLFKIVLISPLFYFFNKNLKGLPNIVFLYMFLFNIDFYVSSKLLFSFSIGSYVALNENLRNKILVPCKNHKLTYLLAFLTVLVGIIYTYLSAAYLTIESPDNLRNILYKSIKLLSLIVIFRLYDVLEDKIKIPNLFLSNTLFIFAMHEPVQQFLASQILKFYNPDYFKLIVFVVLPLIINYVICLFANFLKKYLPRLSSILTGGRV